MAEEDVLDLGKSAEEFSVAISEAAALVERASVHPHTCYGLCPPVYDC